MTSTTMTERTVRVNGRDIFVAEAGAGTPVVLCTAAARRIGRVELFAQHRCPGRKFPRLVPDMPGYGRSSKGVDRSDPFGYLADHIRGMLDELGIQRAHLVGNSYGGACALRPRWTRPIGSTDSC